MLELKPLKILAIDDNQDNLTALKAVVGDAFSGARVVTAQNGPKGIELALAEDPDVILLDIVMPGMDGFEVCRKLKAYNHLQHIPVIFLTALKTDREHRIKALEAGAEGFLTKPLDETELTAQIRAMAKLKAAHEQLRQEKERLAALVAERTQELEAELAERKRAEEVLQESEERYRMIFNHSPLGFMHFDARGIIRDFNAKFPEIIGAPRERILGFNMLEKLSDPAMLQAIKEALDGRVGYYEGDYTSVTGARTTPLRVVYDRITTEDGKVLGGVGIFEEIAERKRAEDALKWSEARYRELASHISSGVAVYEAAADGEDFIFRDFNLAAERMEGMGRDQVLGRGVLEVFPGVKEFGIFAVFQRVWKTGVAEHHPVSFYQDGRICGWRENYVYRLPSGEIVAVYDDVTQRKQAEEAVRTLNEELEQRVLRRTAELEAKNIELETFTYSVSHDLKAPLRGIDGYSRLLLEDHADRLDDEGRMFLQTIRQSTQKMSQLINDLLAYSRMERRSFALGRVKLSSLWDAVFAEQTTDLEARSVRVALDIPCESVIADAEGLTQVFRNLFDNALKFTREVPAPHIEIGGDTTEKTCVLWIRDNGIGFDVQYHDRIFQIFQRLNLAEEYPGTGIGLAIVRKAIGRMGGRVWAESTPGQGATFYVEIPRG
jgi:PAS domain S-box-containing protein